MVFKLTLDILRPPLELRSQGALRLMSYSVVRRIVVAGARHRIWVRDRLFLMRHVYFSIGLVANSEAVEASLGRAC